VAGLWLLLLNPNNESAVLMLFRFFSCACVAVGLGFGGYTTSNQLAGSQHPTRWVLRTLAGQPLSDFQLAAPPELVLPSAAITKGTQHCRGAFQQSTSVRLQTIPHVISTMMGRSNQAIEVEMRYLSALEQTTRFEISGNTLQLYAARQAAPLATFKAARNVF